MHYEHSAATSAYFEKHKTYSDEADNRWQRPWMTPNQIRDELIASSYWTNPGNFDPKVFQILALRETDRRKVLPEFVRCSRCYGYHGETNNIDQLCENCENLTAPYRYDKTRKMAR